MRRQSGRLRRAMIAQARVVGRMRGLAEAAGALAGVAVLLAGAEEVAAGRATGGTVVAAMAIVGLLVAPLRDIGRVQEYWHASRVAMEKLEDFVAIPTRLHEPADAPDLAPGPGRLELDEVVLEGSLHGISAIAPPGAVVALVGPNGAGKSSLLAVASRLVDADAGVVRLDGQDIAAHSLASVHAAISMVGPDLPLLRGTVADNLRYRCPDATQEELVRVRALCGIDALVAELPEGDETRIRDGGRNLSSGQRQRLALARALVGAPRVLLLDEADANLDPVARGVVDRVIHALRGTCTLVVVTHRTEVLEWADAVWRMEAGRLVTRHASVA
jgi:ABC-type bacteriocin/lantibiotic exporter with double-glycine peptidase domain